MRPRIVLANGVFDIFHYGHLLHLEAAKAMGEILIVSITKDESVNKGVGRPVFDVYQRQAIISSLRCVDATMIVSGSLQALQEVLPDIFVKGSEYEGNINEADQAFCDKNRIKILFTHEDTYSSTAILDNESRCH